MRALLISYYFGVADSVGGHRARAMATYLPAHGVDVTALVLAAGDSIEFRSAVIGVPGVSHFYTPRTRYLPYRIAQEVFRFAAYVPVLGRWRDAAIAAGSEVMRRYSPQLVLATYPPVEALEIGLAFAKRYSVPFVADFRDGLLFEPVESRSLRRRAVRAHYGRLEAEVCETARLITTVSSPITEYFQARYRHQRVLTIPNGFDPEELVAASAEVMRPASDKAHLVHTGRFGGSRSGGGLKNLLAALELLKVVAPTDAARICVHLMGELTPWEGLLCRLSPSRGMLKVWGARPRADALALQRFADALLLVVTPGQRSIATGKLFEYLAADRPILAFAEGSEAARIVEETGAGVVLPTDDIVRAAATLQQVAKGSLELHRNESAIKQYTRSVQMARLADELQRL